MNRTERPIRLFACAAAGLVALSSGGCAGGSSSGQATVTVTAEQSVASEPEATEPEVELPAEPANPVPLLKKVKGCVLEAGTESGDRDMNGNRFASCSFMDNSGTPGTTVTVRTFPGDPQQYAIDPEQLKSDDSNKVIIGKDFTAVITGDWSSYSSEVDPKVIAKQVGGTYQSSS